MWFVPRYTTSLAFGAGSCEDDVMDVALADVLAQGSGSLYIVDSSPRMIEAARLALGDAANCTFEGEGKRR